MQACRHRQRGSYSGARRARAAATSRARAPQALGLPLDVLVHCASHSTSSFSLSQDGIESHFAVNYLNPLLLTLLLLPSMGLHQQQQQQQQQQQEQQQRPQEASQAQAASHVPEIQEGGPPALPVSHGAAAGEGRVRRGLWAPPCVRRAVTHAALCCA